MTTQLHAQTSSYYLELLAGAGQTSFKFWRPYTAFDANDVNYGITAGLRHNDNFSMEVTVFDQGRYSDTLTSVGRPDLYANTSSLSLQFSVLGSWPVSPRWSVYGRLGASLYAIDASYVVSDSGRQLQGDDSDAGLVAGVGSLYRFNRRYGLTFDYQRDWYDTSLFYNTQEIDKFLVGVRIYF